MEHVCPNGQGDNRSNWSWFFIRTLTLNLHYITMRFRSLSGLTPDEDCSFRTCAIFMVYIYIYACLLLRNRMGPYQGVRAEGRNLVDPCQNNFPVLFFDIAKTVQRFKAPQFKDKRKKAEVTRCSCEHYLPNMH